MLSGKKEILIYETLGRRAPFDDWLNNLSDRKVRAVIRTRLDRIEYGNFGDAKSIGGGVHELKIHFGSGYRVYFGQDGNMLIILLCGGDKGTQDRDIRKARDYWEDYRRRTK